MSALLSRVSSAARSSSILSRFQKKTLIPDISPPNFSLSVADIRFHQANRSHFQSTFGFDLFGIDDSIAQCDCFCSPQFSALCGILELGFDSSRPLNAFMMEFQLHLAHT